MPIFQGTVGPVASAAGTNPPGGVQQGKAAEVITADFHGRKYTAVYNGSVYIASTAVAGVAPGTAFSTTPPMVVWNPANSGVNLEILKFVLGYISGTLGGGVIAYGQGPQATKPTTGTVLTPVNGILGNSKTGVGQAFQGSTVLQAPTLVRSSSLWLDAFVGTITGPTCPMMEDIDGEFIVAPGNFFAVQGVAAGGTTPLVTLGVTWNEAPI
jgi:hypothetical protein